jgi:UDP-N-acetylglucosamine 2-epimerase (non-hydrolysing)
MQTQATIVCVIGTRPEAIKMAPVVRALRADDRFRCVVVATAQHRGLLDQMLERFRIEVDHDLDLMTEGQSPSELIARMLPALDAVLAQEHCDAVLAQGDTTTVFVSALAAFHRKLPFGHVEAGLRTYDLEHPFPEEGYRQMVSRIARWHFAPTRGAAEALLEEKVLADRIHVTGNTCIDALMQTVGELPPGSTGGERLIVLTAHRRENFGERLARVFEAVRQLADRYEDVLFIYPVHPNPNVRSTAKAHLEGHPRIELIEPLDYFAFVELMQRATLILTDSGGVQEEAPALGKPVLVLRDTTERPEALTCGSSRLVGTDTSSILHEVSMLLDNPAQLADMSRVRHPYGDGTAALEIVRVLSESMMPS